MAPFAGVALRQFNRVVRALRCEGADIAPRGRPWGIPLEDCGLIVTKVIRQH